MMLATAAADGDGHDNGGGEQRRLRRVRVSRISAYRTVKRAE